MLVILNAAVDPRQAEETARHAGVSVHSIHNWIPAYNRSGLAGILDPGTGGRRNAHMTREEERLFLEPHFERAATGEIATVAEVLAQRDPGDTRPVVLMSQDEGRFGRISDHRYWLGFQRYVAKSAKADCAHILVCVHSSLHTSIR